VTESGAAAPVRVSLPLAITAGFFIGAGVMHFIIPGWYARIIPAWLPQPMLLGYVAGVAEIAGGAGLLPAPTRRPAAVGLIVLLAAVFPAHLELLQQAEARGLGWPVIVVCWLRMPLQPLLMWWVWRVAGPRRDLSA
jgi:uncharacterized membrane protein